VIRMTTPRGSRAAQIGDAAIELLAARGMRGLTHRAVDEEAGLPTGTTSNYARTRAALIELALKRMGEREAAEIGALMAATGVPTDLRGYAELTARIITHSVTAARPRMLARYELALEATRRPGLRAAYDLAGRAYRDQAIALLTAAGSADPPRHARLLVAWGEGVMFDTIAGAGGSPGPTPDELRATMAELLRAILPDGATGPAVW
jgi:DNA-binding transcriptional regulator YbjK